VAQFLKPLTKFWAGLEVPAHILAQEQLNNCQNVLPL